MRVLLLISFLAFCNYHLSAQEELFEVAELCGHRYGEFLSLHKLGKPLWYLHVCLQYAVHLLLELCWMSSLQEYSCLTIMQQVLKSLITACTMRVEHISRSGMALSHGLGNLLVRVCCSANLCRYVSMTALV